jgi:hypothetical protein
MVADQKTDMDCRKFHSVFIDTRRLLHDYVIVGVKTE